MSGMVAGKDYVVAGSGTTFSQGQDKTPDNPATDRREQNNPYFVIPTEEIEQPDHYVPPEPVDADDEDALRFNSDGSPAPTLAQQEEEHREAVANGDAPYYVNPSTGQAYYHTPSN